MDRIECRLQTARELGATHVLNTTPSISTFVKDIKHLVGGQRISPAIDVTGVTSTVPVAVECLGKQGRVVRIGVTAPDLIHHIAHGRSFLQHESQ
jgi:threonine dehydrogenase-like Zn-dependent dehydrogenase